MEPICKPNPTTTDTTTMKEKQASAYLEDMDEVEKIFNRFDTNGDGKISASELADVLKALGSDSSPDEVRRMMDDLDTDHDGFINLAEFATFCKDSAAAAAGGGESSPDDGGVRELRDAFELYDKDKNGLISAAELHLVLTRLGESCSVQDCSRMIESVDYDGDGYVNFEEFKTMMMKNSSSKVEQKR